MKILAVDLGKFKSTACIYHTETAQHAFQTLPTRPQAVHDLIVTHAPDRLVIEVGSQAGWVSDLAEALEVGEIQALGQVRTKQVMGVGDGGGDAPNPKALARISITLVQRSARTVLTEEAHGSIAGAFIEGWKSLKATTAFIINGLIVMLPWIVIIGLLTFAVRRARRNRPASDATPTTPEPNKK